MPFRQLNEVQLDALKEVSNIGMGHAATALSQMLGHRVALRVPSVAIVEIGELPEQLGGAEQLMVGITLQILGDARGSIMLLFSQESAHRMICRLLGRQEEALAMHELSASTLKEVGNILASAYLIALGGLLDKTLIPSVPSLAYDMGKAVADAARVNRSEAGDLALMVETEFSGGAGEEAFVKGHFFLLPDPLTLSTFLSTVGGEG